jgi:hypothetical protein
MLFHTNFENPIISQNQYRYFAKKEAVEPKPEPSSRLKFTVRSLLPTKTKTPKPSKPAQENEVRLFNPQPYTMTKEERIMEKKREKRRKYKKNKSKKMRVLKNKEITEGEQDFIEMVNYIEDNEDIEFDICVQDYSQRLNVMTKLYKEFMSDDDVLEL